MAPRQPNVGRQPRRGRQPQRQSVSALKKQIRAIERLLKRPDLPEGGREKQQALLATAEGKLREAKRQRLEAFRSTKYHKVKFFERQKCERMINKIKRRLEGPVDTAEQRDLQKKLHQLELDMRYIRFYPPGEKYISLYANGQETNTILERKRRKMRRLVEKRAVLMERQREHQAVLDDDAEDDEDDEDSEDQQAGRRERTQKSTTASEDDFFL